jgi:hypothetical protein
MKIRNNEEWKSGRNNNEEENNTIRTVSEPSRVKIELTFTNNHKPKLKRDGGFQIKKLLQLKHNQDFNKGKTRD